MLGHTLLQVALLFCVTPQSLQGGVPTQGGALGRLGGGRGAATSPGAGGAKAAGPGLTFPPPGFGGGQFPSSPSRGVPFEGQLSKMGGRFPGAQFGPGPGFGDMLDVTPQLGKQRRGYGSKGLGHGGLPLGGFRPGTGAYPRPGLGPAAGHAVGAALQNGQGAKAAKAGYAPWTAGYPGARLANGYGPDFRGTGQGGYPVGGLTNGYRAGAAGLGEGGKAQPAGYGNDYGAAPNGYRNGLGYPTIVADAAGLGGKAGKGPGGAVAGPGAAAAQLPYGGQPAVPAGLGANGKAGIYIGAQPSYWGQAVQPVGLGADEDLGALGGDLRGGLGLDSAAGKYGNGRYPYGPQTAVADGRFVAGYGNGAYQNGGVAPSGGKESKYGRSRFLGNGYQG